MRNNMINLTYHSHMEKKIDLPEFNKASLIGGYLIFNIYETCKDWFFTKHLVCRPKFAFESHILNTFRERLFRYFHNYHTSNSQFPKEKFKSILVNNLGLYMWYNVDRYKNWLLINVCIFYIPKKRMFWHLVFHVPVIQAYVYYKLDFCIKNVNDQKYCVNNHSYVHQVQFNVLIPGIWINSQLQAFSVNIMS